MWGGGGGGGMHLIMRGICIQAKPIGVGYAAPDTSITNSDMEKIVETTGEWIQTRTGIQNRCVCVLMSVYGRSLPLCVHTHPRACACACACVHSLNGR